MADKFPSPAATKLRGFLIASRIRTQRNTEIRTCGMFVTQNVQGSNLRSFTKQNIQFITLELYKNLTHCNVVPFAVKNFYQAT
jgi:hypothetical protein